MTFLEAQAAKCAIEAEISAIEVTLRAFPKGAMGLTTDEAKASLEYLLARTAFNCAFTRLRVFNQKFTKFFANEIRAERRMRRNTQ